MSATTLDPRIADGDWEEAFVYARTAEPVIGSAAKAGGFTLEDVAEVISTSDGENDGPEWLGVFRLRDGRFAFLSAGCDYTGWDCQAGGTAVVASDLAELVRFGITQPDRERLSLTL